MITEYRCALPWESTWLFRTTEAIKVIKRPFTESDRSSNFTALGRTSGGLWKRVLGKYREADYGKVAPKLPWSTWAPLCVWWHGPFQQEPALMTPSQGHGGSPPLNLWHSSPCGHDAAVGCSAPSPLDHPCPGTGWSTVWQMGSW